jgi:uncharacterized protein YndB with AHSA1/START domain
MKAILGLVLALVIAVGAYVAWRYHVVQEAATGAVKEIVSESITRSGDTWKISFTSRFDAPIDKVWEAFSHPERIKDYAPENVLKVEIMKEEGNTKTVEVVGKSDVLPPGFKVQDIVTEYVLFPDEHRITTKTIDFKLADITTEYRFEPTQDGKGTLLKFTETSKDKAPLIVESLQKGALREQYIVQVRAANRAMGLAAGEAKRPAGG